MKSLKDFIIESTVQESEENTKTFTLDFNGIDDSTDMVNSLKAIAGVKEDEENKLVFTVYKSQEPEYLSKLKEVIKDISAQQKNYSDEQYAQKVKKLKDSLKEIESFSSKEEVEKSDEEKKKEEEAKKKEEE